MNPVALQVLDPAGFDLQVCTAALQRLAPGVGVDLLPHRHRQWLMPGTVWVALEQGCGTERLADQLAAVGLERKAVLSNEECLRWLRCQNEGGANVPSQQALTSAAAPGDLARDVHLALCRLPQAWPWVGGPDAIDWGVGQAGGALRVGHVDTGYTRHPVFGFPAAPFVDVRAARSFVSRDAALADGLDPVKGWFGGHGTGSASVLAGLDPGGGYTGAAPRVPWVPARVSDSVILDRDATAFRQAVRYLVEDQQVAVVSVAMGTALRPVPPRAIRRAVDSCYDRGVILVAAAGNVPVPGWPAFPAALPRSIAVAGVDNRLRPWSVSSSGAWVDVCAPAKAVWRASVDRSQHYGYTNRWGGTTFAASMTAGAAALWLLRHRDEIKRRYREPWQKVEAFRWALRTTAQVPTAWPEKGWGAGVLDAEKLMDPATLPAAADLQRR